MPTHKFAPVLGKRLRITEMLDSGAVGANSIVTDGFLTVNMTAETEDGTEITVRNAAGALCINERQSPSFKRLNVEIEFCGVNPALLAMVSNAKEYEDWAGDVAGFTIPEGVINGGFALEVWTGLAGAINDTNASGYLLLPWVSKGVLGDITIDGENAVTFSITGASTKGNHSWGVGPFNVVMNDETTPVPAKLPTPLDPFDHFLLIDTAVPAPLASDEPVPVPA